MKAFENTEVSKQELLASLARHRATASLIKGTYWDPAMSRGRAVGCSIHDFRPGHEGEHGLYPELFGIPVELAKLEDEIFEKLPSVLAYEWPERFVSAINPGADLAQVEDRFVLWMLSDTKSPLSEWADEPWMKRVADLYRRRLAGEEPDTTEWTATRDAALDAAFAATRDAADGAWDAARARTAAAAVAARAGVVGATAVAARAGAVDATAVVAAKEAAWAAMAYALVRILSETTITEGERS